MSNQLSQLLLGRTVLPEGQQEQDQKIDPKLLAQLLMNWNPLERKPVYQPTTTTSGVRG